MDKIAPNVRSRNMANIKAKNTKPELQVRKYLYANGFRYRIHFKLPGKPDIVFPNKKFAIFVNGCFWHGHGCKLDHKPKSNTKFWENKIKLNTERDRKNLQLLKDAGWKVYTVWECELKADTEGAIQYLTAN